MFRRIRFRWIVLTTMTAVLGVMWFAGDATSQTEPPLPEWVQPDGTIDMSRAPRQLPVLGADGRPLRDASGRPVVRPFLEPPPAPAPLTASEQARFEQERTAAEARDRAADRDREVPDALRDGTSADDALTVPPIKTAP